jgi:hypothetical protein
VELQDPSPRLLITALRFGAISPVLLDTRGTLAATLSENFGLPEWNAPADAVQLYTKDARRLFQVSIRDVYFSTENFEDLEEERSWGTSIMSATLEALGVAEIAWMGTRMHWLSATDSFRELCDWFMSRFGSAVPAAAGVLGRSPSDLGVVLEFKDKNPLVTMRFGPMRAEQAISQLFRDKDPTHYPDDFLFLDIDRVHPDETLKTRDALSQWNKRVASLARLGEQVAMEIASAS